MNIFERLFRGKPKPKPAEPQQSCPSCARYAELIAVATAYGNFKQANYLVGVLAQHAETHRRVNPYVSPED